MATTVTEARSRADVLDDLAYYRHKAGRMTCVDPNYALVHAAINEKLTELGY